MDSGCTSYMTRDTCILSHIAQYLLEISRVLRLHACKCIIEFSSSQQPTMIQNVLNVPCLSVEPLLVSHMTKQGVYYDNSDFEVFELKSTFLEYSSYSKASIMELSN